MKKITMTLVILLGLTFGSFAQEGGLFGKGPSRGGENGFITNRANESLMLPGEHGRGDDQPGTEPAPLGSGVLVLAGLGAAYMVAKKNKKK